VTGNDGVAGVFYGSSIHVHSVGVGAARAASSWPRRIGVVPGLADCRQRRQADEDLLATATDTDPAEGAIRFLAWLAEPHGRRWLIVLDDVAAPGDLAGLWPPSIVGGRVLVTTRRRDAALAAEGRRVVNVGLFTPEEAHRYLREKLGAEPGRLDEPERLAADLGYLPLALAQAAAYLIDRGLTCAGYRRRFAERKRPWRLGAGDRGAA
jgi:hypothetical protein